MRESFVFHRDFMAELWDSAEERLKWYDRIFLYALDDKEPEITERNEKKAWGALKAHIDADRESWEKKIEYQKAYRERMKEEKKVLKTFKTSETNESFQNKKNICPNTPNVFESESEFVSEFDSEYVFESEYESEFKREGEQSSPAPSKTRFKKPTLEEVTQYVSEKSYTFSPTAFWNFYESNGWKVGKNSMKDWKKACVTWNERSKTDNKGQKISADFRDKDEYNWGGVEI